MTSQMKNTLLAASLAINAILVAGLYWSQGNARRAMTDAMAEAAEASATFQRDVLADLRSGDKERIKAAADRLSASIDANTRISYKTRTSQEGAPE